jgi:signal transduction histidine kinase
MSLLGGTNEALNAQPTSGQLLAPLLTWLRWTIIATMLLIVLAWPVPARTGHPLWPYVLAFAGYNLLVALLRGGVARLRSYTWVPFLDLPIAGILYFLDAEPGGPLFVTFYLAVVTAAACWSLRATLLYTAAVIAVITVVAPTLPQWSPTPGNLRQLAARMVVLTVVGVGTAIMARRLMRQEATAQVLRDDAERLEELDRLRTQFVATVSHDLLTPLTAIGAALGLLETSGVEQLRPEQRDLLANARRNTERLSRLIDNLLAYNQLQAGILRLDLELIDLRSVVADSVSAVQPLMRQKGQTLEIDLPAPLPIEADPRWLEQVVVNLLANAHRHTALGTRVAVTGRVGDGEIRLTVRDDGLGIPVEELEAIFRRFHRLGSGKNGSGLGLAIARGLVELHGGRLWAESGAGRGASFHVALPLLKVGREPCP